MKPRRRWHRWPWAFRLWMLAERVKLWWCYVGRPHLVMADPSVEEEIDQVLVGHGIRIDLERRRRLRLITDTEDCA